MRFTATTPMALITGLILVILTGCVNLGPGTTDTTRLYVLAPMQNDAAEARQAYNRAEALGVGPLAFPDHLNRPQIVTRIGENKIQTAVFDNWAEPLQGNFLRVLAENLALLLGTDAVYVHPWRSTLKDIHRIELEVLRFDAEMQGEAVLIVRWELTDARGRQLLPKRRAVYRQRVADANYDAIVAAMILALADFSRDLAAALAALN